MRFLFDCFPCLLLRTLIFLYCKNHQFFRSCAETPQSFRKRGAESRIVRRKFFQGRLIEKILDAFAFRIESFREDPWFAHGTFQRPRHEGAEDVDSGMNVRE